QDSDGRFEPTECPAGEGGIATSDLKGLPVERQHRAQLPGLPCRAERAPGPRLRKPRRRRRACRTEAERRLVTVARVRDPTAVASWIGAAGAEEHRILEHLVRQVFHLGQPELLTLV